ncbi:glycosyltransferase family 2 protein [Candidatus Woesearchaeota archaeon]|nr:glycosyltransferase family 2 protein [Candidatus Woesearchaeota archaeon]
MLLSIVIPVMNEAGNIIALYEKLKSVLAKINHEIIYVDDGGTDDTPNIIAKLQKRDNKIRLVQFRRNFGKSAALAAGFRNAEGSVIITMDGDLQDDPSDIPKLLKRIDDGFDLVVGWKQKKYKWYELKLIPSKIFNLLTSMLTGVRLHDIDCPFKAFRREVTNGLSIYGELYRYIPVLVHQKGFKVTEVEVKNLPRKYGKSKFGTDRLVKGFLDLITVFFLTRFKKRPSHFFGSLGLFLLMLGVVLGIYLAIKRFIFGVLIVKEAYIMLAVLFVILGVQFISTGLIGEMLINNRDREEEYCVVKKK